MSKADTIVQTILSEKDDYYSDDSLYDINSWGADLSFRELISRYEDDELVKPEIQRNYVWDKSEASRFIDSILLGLPIPSIFLAKTDDEKMLIVDGYQRIMTVYDYVRGIFGPDKQVFKLTNTTKINSAWRGKAFSELSETEQRRIKNSTIHSIIFVQVNPKEDDTSLYQIFERINTSGKTLLPQEIRNCVYQGSFNRRLIELNQDDMWRALYGLEKSDPRMRDIEFILRFLAMSSIDFRTEEIKTISLKKFLNDYMGKFVKAESTVLDPQCELFLNTIRQVKSLFGAVAFHNISTKYPDRLVSKFNPTIYDSVMIATQIAFESGMTVQHNNYPKRRIKLLSDPIYSDAIRIRTTNIAKIKTRISLALRYLFDIEYE